MGRRAHGTTGPPRVRGQACTYLAYIYCMFLHAYVCTYVSMHVHICEWGSRTGRVKRSGMEHLVASPTSELQHTCPVHCTVDLMFSPVIRLRSEHVRIDFHAFQPSGSNVNIPSMDAVSKKKRRTPRLPSLHGRTLRNILNTKPRSLTPKPGQPTSQNLAGRTRNHETWNPKP